MSDLTALKISGSNDPTKQVSFTRWNAVIDAIEDASSFTIGDVTIGDGTATVNAFAFMTPLEIADVIARTYTVNVTLALQAAAAEIVSLGGGILILPPGGYLVGLQTFQGVLLGGGDFHIAYGPQEIITIKNSGHVKISGYGAVMKAANGLHFGSFDYDTGLRYDPAPGEMPYLDYTSYAYPYRGMLNLDNNKSVTIEGLELDGNSPNYVLGGHFGDSQWQMEGHGIWCKGCDRVTINDVYSHHHPTDGMILAFTGLTEASDSKPSVITNLKCRYNGRQGVSLVGGKNVTFINPDFSYTGRAVNLATSEVLQTAPGCGIDLEAESAVIRDITFTNPRMVGNYVRGFGAASGDSARVLIKGGVIEGALIARFGYHFEDVTFVGNSGYGLTPINYYKPFVQGLTLTIAGAGPYTITRSAGSFLTDGFKAGDTLRLMGMGAGNIGKDLYATSVTATVITVSAADTTLTPEGPIAAATLGIATTEADGAKFTRCTFTMDPAFTEDGTIVNTTSMSWLDMRYARFTDCLIDMGAIALPNAYHPVLSPASPVWENCTFRSTATDLIAINGYLRGINRITYSGTVQFNFGTDSLKEYGAVYLNGTAV